MTARTTWTIQNFEKTGNGLEKMRNEITADDFEKLERINPSLVNEIIG